MVERNSKYIENKSVEEIQNEIDCYRNLDLQALSIKEIEEKIGNIILGHIKIIYNIKPAGLVRGRKNLNSESFLHKKKLIYPNWDEIPLKDHKYGRCGDKGEIIMYASTETDTAICELALEESGYFTLADFKSNKTNLEIKAQVIGIKEISESREDYRKLFNSYYDKLKVESPQEYEKNILIDNFLSTQFQQIVPENENWKYKITIAISHILFSGEDFDALVFPSIASCSKGVNFALKKDFVDDNLKFIRAGFYEVIQTSNENNPTVRLIQIPKPIDPEKYKKDGITDIKWTSPPKGFYEEFTVPFK